ncbi:hypothetical protein R1flu_009390 [Riccia fluitans]|uniref:Secreted protein n=1 Tax=Riccia fluitans TaxID=41844 RepID=A0ABD1Z1Z0_9MARC
MQLALFEAALCHRITSSFLTCNTRMSLVPWFCPVKHPRQSERKLCSRFVVNLLSFTSVLRSKSPVKRRGESWFS